MLIEPKELNKKFREVIRSIDRTSKWKSKGVRRYWDFEGEIWVGLELVYLSKMTTRNDISIYYSILFSFPFKNNPYFYSSSMSCDDDRVIIIFDFDVTNKRIMGFQERVDRRKIDSSLSLDNDILLFKNAVIDCLDSWEKKYRSKKSIIKYLNEILHPENAFWLIREQFGNQVTRQHFLEYLKDYPYARPSEKFTSWLETYDVIDLELKKKIDRASIQARDRIPEFMEPIIEELDQKT